MNLGEKYFILEAFSQEAMAQNINPAEHPQSSNLDKQNDGVVTVNSNAVSKR